MFFRHRLTIRQAANLLDLGLITSEELTSYCYALAMAGEEIWDLNAYTDDKNNNTNCKDGLVDLARSSDDRRRHGETLSIFDGIPISIKSNLAVKSEILSAGSRILQTSSSSSSSSSRQEEDDGRKNFAASCGYDADTTRILLRECGAVLMGMTTMDEFGMGSLGSNVKRASDGSDIFTKNPLPMLRHLTLDDKPPFAYATPTSGVDPNIEPISVTEMVEIIRKPYDFVMERHMDALRAATTVADGTGTGGISYSAGGSSCGSAVSVAHGSALLSLGTDTGGSVRLPAAWCGIIGLKPSYGLLSRHGVVSYASSFDTVGILAPTVDCAELALEKLAQRNVSTSRDSTFSSYNSYKQEQQEQLDDEKNLTSPASSSLPLSGIRIGIPSSLSIEECSIEAMSAWSDAATMLQSYGATIEQLSNDDISLDLVKRALSAYYVLVSAEASSNLSRYDGFRYGTRTTTTDILTTNKSLDDLTALERQYMANRTYGFGPEVTRRILCGTSVLSSDKFHTHYEGGAMIRAELSRQLYSVLDDKVDVLLIPTALFPPPPLLTTDDDTDDSTDENGADDKNDVDSTEMFANDVMTVIASLAGLPALSVPIMTTTTTSSSSPPSSSSSSSAATTMFTPSVQLIGSRLDEATVLKVAKSLHK